VAAGNDGAAAATSTSAAVPISSENIYSYVNSSVGLGQAILFYLYSQELAMVQGYIFIRFFYSVFVYFSPLSLSFVPQVVLLFEREIPILTPRFFADGFHISETL